MIKLTTEKEIRQAVEKEHERTGGIFRLLPCWVGRPGIIVPGRRIKLLDDYISQDVAVNERWLASVTYADNMLYLLEEKGTMKLVNATPEQYDEVSSFKVPKGMEGIYWAHPVVCGGRLYIRHADKLYAHEISSK